jgi:sulfate adenylyltransferase subunit 1
VDDGKSTLIGRLLFDSKGILADQLDAIERASTSAPGAVDLSLLTDGLQAEREQGITIDVAYRYFATASASSSSPTRRATSSTPATWSPAPPRPTPSSSWSTCQGEAREGSVELLTQTKRHSTIAHLLQIQHVIVAVNKMDLVDYDQTVYDRIVGAYQQFAQQLGLNRRARHSAVGPGRRQRGHRQRAPGLVPRPDADRLLESLSVYEERTKKLPLPGATGGAPQRSRSQRLPWLHGPHRSRQGQGDKLVVLPSGQSATVKDIQTLDGRWNRPRPASR